MDTLHLKAELSSEALAGLNAGDAPTDNHRKPDRVLGPEVRSPKAEARSMIHCLLVQGRFSGSHSGFVSLCFVP